MIRIIIQFILEKIIITFIALYIPTATIRNFSLNYGIELPMWFKTVIFWLPLKRELNVYSISFQISSYINFLLNIMNLFMFCDNSFYDLGIFINSCVFIVNIVLAIIYSVRYGSKKTARYCDIHNIQFINMVSKAVVAGMSDAC